MLNLSKVTVGGVVIVVLAVDTLCTGGTLTVICGAILSGTTAGGAFGAVMGAVGGGIQYLLGTPLDQLINKGIIKIFGG